MQTAELANLFSKIRQIFPKKAIKTKMFRIYRAKLVSSMEGLFRPQAQNDHFSKMKFGKLCGTTYFQKIVTKP